MNHAPEGSIIPRPLVALWTSGPEPCACGCGTIILFGWYSDGIPRTSLHLYYNCPRTRILVKSTGVRSWTDARPVCDLQVVQLRPLA